MGLFDVDPIEECEQCGSSVLEIYIEDGLCPDCQVSGFEWNG
jgi:hypothetical protein